MVEVASVVAAQAGAAGSPTDDLISFALSRDLALTMRVATLPLLIIVILAGAVLLAWRFFRHRRLPEFEIDSAELGFGDHKISFKPNTLDRQIAYSIWVELSTRKIGLNIDPEDDVVAEVYD